jgi:hypothetical protein
MPSYDAMLYDPPAAVASVRLRASSGGAIVSAVLLLIDSGADITLLPRLAVEQLGVPLVGGDEYELVGFNGSKSRAQAVDLDMIFLNRAYRGRYLLIDDERGVLGRDVLASVCLILNGPRQEWLEQLPTS